MAWSSRGAARRPPPRGDQAITASVEDAEDDAPGAVRGPRRPPVDGERREAELDEAGAEAEADDRLAKERKLFHRPAVLKGNIAFWRRVFAEYSERQSVIHDLRKPDRIYAVLDYRAEDRKSVV